MCGRYSMGDGAEPPELRQLIEEVNRRDPGRIKTGGEVFPSDAVPVVAQSRDRQRGVFAMRWGYRMPDGKLLINARSESAAERPLFRDGMRQRRCAIPAVCYYEWSRQGAAREKFAIRPARAELFYLAGLYRLVSSGPEFCVLTREATRDISRIHDRMPVMLSAGMIDEWISPSCAPGELLSRALTDVEYGAADPAGPEGDRQLSMQWD